MIRKTSQDLAPLHHRPTPSGQYDIYPAFPVGDGKISADLRALAQTLAQHKRVVIDGYVGVLWKKLRDDLDEALKALNVNAKWCDVQTAYLPELQINTLIAPYLGGDDPIFGTRFTGTLNDFFDGDKLTDLRPSKDEALSIVYGCGGALAKWDDALLVYVDIPKNEIQFRSRAGSICNLGVSEPENPKAMYKRFYFVDWVVLNQHKAVLLPDIDLLVDAQRPDAPVWMSGDDLRAAMAAMSKNYFRVRPWFEPGAWGGQWIKERIPQLPREVPNYAWSFELIVPENGLMVESDHLLLEFSFDFLMYHDPHAVTGNTADRFGYEFPVRFDFLDTFDGGNLSLQCHPNPDYIRRSFGESFTQDETYYILDCEDDAQVYLGFQEGINPQEFRDALERSFQENIEVDVKKFVQVHPAKKHDLFLIPHGIIHCSGKNNLVLEISATPYIFTFKMYDWLRLDLDDKPRPLNIERAFDNLRFELQGERVQKELISHQRVQETGEGWWVVHIPTHPDHFYDVCRYEIAAGASVDISTNGSFYVMSLVEGSTVLLETSHGMQPRFNYAETFVVPAAAGRFTLVNDTDSPIKVVAAFMKEGHV